MVFLDQRAHGSQRLAGPTGRAAVPQAVQPPLGSVRARRPGGRRLHGLAINHAFLVGPAIGYAARWIQSFKDFPPRQKPGSFNLSHVMEKLRSHRSRSSWRTDAREGGGELSPPPAREPLLDCATRCRDAPAEPSRAPRRAPFGAVQAHHPIGAAAGGAAPGLGRDGARVRNAVGQAARPGRGRRSARRQPGAERVLRGPGAGGSGFRPPGRPNHAAAQTLWLARGRRRDPGVRDDARPLALGDSLRRAPGRGRPAGLAAALHARRAAGVPDGRHAAGALARPASGRRQRRAGDRALLRREHRRRRPGHPGDALRSRAQPRHHALGAAGRSRWPCRRRDRPRSRSAQRSLQRFERGARSAALRRPARARALRRRRRDRAGLRGRLVRAARAVPEHARARLRGHARDLPGGPRDRQPLLRAMESGHG